MMKRYLVRALFIEGEETPRRLVLVETDPANGKVTRIMPYAEETYSTTYVETAYVVDGRLVKRPPVSSG